MTSIGGWAAKVWVARCEAVTYAMTGVLILVVGLAVVTDGHQVHHGRAAPSGNDQRGIHDSKIVQDQDHINEHLADLTAAVNVSAMTHEELEFHYFKMHDFDNNTKLDGLEILKALTHVLPYEDDDSKVDVRGKSADQIAREKREKLLLYYTEIVDTVLQDDDIDDDGYLTYPEYIIARRRAEAQEELEERSSSSSSSSGHSRSSGSHHHR